MVKSSLPPPKIQTELTEELAERGWRTQTLIQPDGTTKKTQIPLTSAEFLHPEEGYQLPISTFHSNICRDAEDILLRRYAKDATVVVFRDLIIVWDDEDIKPHCPDVCVVFGVQNKEQNRPRFIVADEGVKPALIIEVVSPRYRKEDREIKVIEYEQAGVQEYVIIDRRTQRGEEIDEILGYRLINERYRLLTPDDDGRILCETIGLWISLRDGSLMMEDAETGERLLTSGELEERATQAETRATQAERRVAQLAELLRAQGIDPDQV
ncbi:Uma2 family endonuclease [Microseira sp. BLCC-F43]|jgi:Uma2 family endonuclease|uniref:Uma2 family endonuclease n=1 Tax=Microseira sp. BLCC-F43 TaxID=3153602 RepID=UPI0035B94083